ncbi:hypothetical protein EhV156_00088 [Emiliania huxleyi virus 156]|nr:hypothetical protein EhV156_00088 [Emiliania huxleyi virus 156]
MLSVFGPNARVLNPDMSIDHQIKIGNDKDNLTWVRPEDELLRRNINRQQNLNKNRNSQQRANQATSGHVNGIYKNPFL